MDNGSSCDLLQTADQRVGRELSNTAFWFTGDSVILANRTITNLWRQPVDTWPMEGNRFVAVRRRKRVGCYDGRRSPEPSRGELSHSETTTTRWRTAIRQMSTSGMLLLAAYSVTPIDHGPGSGNVLFAINSVGGI